MVLISVGVNCPGRRYRESRGTIVLGLLLIQIDWLMIQPVFCSIMNHLFSLYMLHLLVNVSGVGQNTMENHGLFIQNPFHWRNYIKVCSISVLFWLAVEFLEANTVQVEPAENTKICNFYTHYGPSACNCYEACSREKDMEVFQTKMESAVQTMGWEAIQHLLASTDFTPHLEQEASLIVVIEPADDKRIKPIANIISRTIMRSLWQQHGKHIRLRAQELFQLFSQHPRTSQSAGYLFEVGLHLQLEKGINVPLDPMTFRQNNRKDAVNDKYEASNITSGRWVSQPMVYIPFTTNDRNLRLEPSHYYVPIDSTHPTYDSFTFDHIQGYNGPIFNPSNRELIKRRVPVSMTILIFDIFFNLHAISDRC